MNIDEIIGWLKGIEEKYIHGGDEEFDKKRKKAIDLAIKLLKKQKSLLGIQQTADSITFISTGDAQKGEERGFLLGKSAMHEWIKKELIHRGLMTDEIRAVFRDATTI